MMVKRTNKERRNNLRNPLRRAIKRTQGGKYAATGQRNIAGKSRIRFLRRREKVHTKQIFEKSGK